MGSEETHVTPVVGCGHTWLLPLLMQSLVFVPQGLLG